MQEVKNKQFNFTKILFSIFLLFIQLQQTLQSDIYSKKIVINTGLNLTKALAISPFNNEKTLMIGSQNGTIKLFNFQTGQHIKEINDHQNEILQILWQNDKQGLITISVDKQNNKSLAILRDRNHKQIYKWNYDQLIYSADSTSDFTTSYVGFNFQSRIQQFNLKTKLSTFIYKISQTSKYIQFIYSNDYKYMFAIQNGNKRLFNYKAGTNVGAIYYSFGDKNISNLVTNQFSHGEYPQIFQLNDQGYLLIDPTYNIHQYKFPNQKIQQFIFCPNKYILGLTPNDTIIIFDNDYQFNNLDQIKLFDKNQNNPKILTIKCLQQKVIVSLSNGKVHVIQLLSEDQPINWVKILVIVLISLIIVGFILFKIIKYKMIKNVQSVKNVKKNKQEKQNLIKKIDNQVQTDVYRKIEQN